MWGHVACTRRREVRKGKHSLGYSRVGVVVDLLSVGQDLLKAGFCNHGFVPSYCHNCRKCLYCGTVVHQSGDWCGGTVVHQSGDWCGGTVVHQSGDWCGRTVVH